MTHHLNGWVCSSGGRDPSIPRCLASSLISPLLEGSCGFWVLFDPGRRLSPFLFRRRLPRSGGSPLRRVDSTADPTGLGAFRSGGTGSVRTEAGIACSPRTDLRREAWILRCVAATDGDPAQHGVRRQDVAISTIRFGRRSGESNGSIRIGTFSCSSRKGRRFAGPPSGVTGLESRGVSCQFFVIPRMKRPSSVSPTAIPASAGISLRTGRVGRPGWNLRHEQRRSERQVSGSGRTHAPSRGRRLGLTTGPTARHDGT